MEELSTNRELCIRARRHAEFQKIGMMEIISSIREVFFVAVSRTDDELPP
jgi:hypothetical protein